MNFLWLNGKASHGQGGAQAELLGSLTMRHDRTEIIWKTGRDHKHKLIMLISRKANK